MTPLVDKQPVKNVKHVTDGVAGELFTGRHDRLLERHFVWVVVGQMMKLNTENHTRTLPAAGKQTDKQTCLYQQSMVETAGHISRKPSGIVGLNHLKKLTPNLIQIQFLVLLIMKCFITVKLLKLKTLEFANFSIFIWCKYYLAVLIPISYNSWKPQKPSSSAYNKPGFNPKNQNLIKPPSRAFKTLQYKKNLLVFYSPVNSISAFHCIRLPTLVGLRYQTYVIQKKQKFSVIPPTIKKSNDKFREWCQTSAKLPNKEKMYS